MKILRYNYWRDTDTKSKEKYYLPNFFLNLSTTELLGKCVRHMVLRDPRNKHKSILTNYNLKVRKFLKRKYWKYWGELMKFEKIIRIISKNKSKYNKA